MVAERPIVLVLTGPSSSGETSLARAIQQRSDVPFAHLEADRIFPSMPPDVHQATIRDRGLDTVVLALHRSMATWAYEDLNLIVDGSLPYGDPELRARCLDLFAVFDLRVVRRF